MAYYSSEEFDRLIEARARHEVVSAYEIEQAARRLQAKAVADYTAKLTNGVKTFFTAPAQQDLPLNAPYKLSQREEAYLERGEEIADTLIAAGTAISAFAAWAYAPVKAWLAQSS